MKQKKLIPIGIRSTPPRKFRMAWHTCTACNGTGKQNGKECPVCHGSGEVY